MRVGLSTASFYPRLEVMEAIESCGLFGPGPCEVHLNAPSYYTAEFGRRCKARAGDLGLEIQSCHAMSGIFEPELFSRLGSQVAYARDTLCRFLDAAAEMGAERYIFHGQSAYYGRRLPPPDYPRIAEVLIPIAALCADRGITLCIETVNYGTYHTCDFPTKLAALMPPGLPWQLCLDIKQTLYTDDGPYAFLDEALPWLAQIHLCDVRGDRPVLPGRGEFLFELLGQVLQRHHFDGNAYIEVYAECFETRDQLEKSLRQMKDIFEVPHAT